MSDDDNHHRLVVIRFDPPVVLDSVEVHLTPRASIVNISLVRQSVRTAGWDGRIISRFSARSASRRCRASSPVREYSLGTFDSEGFAGGQRQLAAVSEA